MTKDTSTPKAAPAAAQPLNRRDYVALLTDAEAAQMLAVEPRTLRLWRKTRGLPHLRLTARTIRYRAGDLEAWLARHRVAIG